MKKHDYQMRGFHYGKHTGHPDDPAHFISPCHRTASQSFRYIQQYRSSFDISHETPNLMISRQETTSSKRTVSRRLHLDLTPFVQCLHHTGDTPTEGSTYGGIVCRMGADWGVPTGERPFQNLYAVWGETLSKLEK